MKIHFLSRLYLIRSADRSRPVDFPDFTKGKWKTTPPIKLMGV